MIAAGCDPDNRAVILRRSKRVWNEDKPLAFWAGKDIREMPNGGFVWRKYRPIPEKLISDNSANNDEKLQQAI